MLFEDKEYKADQKGHRLADCRGDGGPHHPPGQHPHKKVVQNDVRDKARYHGRHGRDCSAHVANERNQASSRDLEYRPIADKAQVLAAVLQYLAGRAEQTQDLRTGEQEQGGKENAEAAQQEDRHTHVLPAAVFILIPGVDGVLDCAAHADAGAYRLQKSRQRIGDVDCGQGVVPHRISNKEPIGNRVDAGQRKGQHGWDDKPEKLFANVHFNRLPP